VLVGAIVPVIPTGALVSASAAAALYSKYPETVLLVIALLAVFREQVTTAVKNAFDSVSGAAKT